MAAARRGIDGLDYRFDDETLLQTALTHRSAGSVNNERLEFLGDALLNTIIAIDLFERHPDAPEGDLSRLRAALVRGVTLAKIARELGLGELVYLGEGERKSGTHRRDSILADTLEALFGAIYLDSDFETVEALIRRLFAERLENLPAAEELKDPKTRLQEYLQRDGRPLPEYELIEATGADHARQFTVRCRVDALDIECVATASSRRRAEQQAARDCIDRIVAS